MSIVDVALFESLSPRSAQRVLCKCDRCGVEKMIKKHHLFKVRKDGKIVELKVSCEPEGFVPNYEFCQKCSPIVYPRNKGRKASEETKRKQSEARRGEKNWRWNSDRASVEGVKALRKQCGDMIWNTLRAKYVNCQTPYERVTGFSREYLISWLESKVPEGESLRDMEIDHIFPVSAFFHHGITDLAIINHPTNLQVLSRKENRTKHNRYDEDQFWAYLKSLNYVPSATEEISRSR